MSVSATTLILHIGCEKTGTTSIQRFLARARTALKSHGVLFPVVPAGGAAEPNHKLLTLCVRNTNVDDLRATVPDVDKKIADFELEFSAEIIESGCNTVVLSNEHCSSRLVKVDEIRALKSLLEKFAETIEIIVYVRRQDKMVQSLYSTYIKSGGIEKFRFPENINDPMLNYQLLLDRWSEVFGWRQILVRSYDDVMSDRGDVVRDFLLTAGLSQSVGSAQTSDDKPNRSLNKGTLEFLRLFNKYVPYLKDGVLNEKRADIVRRLELISTRDEGPHDDLGAQEFLERFRESNEYVAREYLARDNGQLFPEYDAIPSGRISEFSVEEAVRIAADLWIETHK